jgi:hypothetical protein
MFIFMANLKSPDRLIGAMPPRKLKTPTKIVRPSLVSRGSGMTTGLELWRIPMTSKIIMIDRTADGRFAVDVLTWNSVAGLNAADTQLLKDATCEDTA